MTSKAALADAAKEVVAKERARQEENGTALVPASPISGVHALAQMSEEAFEARLAAMKQSQQRIARVQREYMDEGIDYGNIAGIDKPTIFKPGAEKLMQLYGLVAQVNSHFVPGDGQTTPPLTYDSDVFLHVGNFDGPIVGQGHGTANSWEKRYRRESRACPNCNQPKIIRSKWPENIPADQRGWYCLNCKSKYGKDDESITAQEVGAGTVMEAYDLGVTLLKMSEKRGITDAVLRATATSGLFTQDVADEPVTDDTAAGFADSAYGGEAEPVVRMVPNTTQAEPFDAAQAAGAVPVAQTGYAEPSLEEQLQASIDAEEEKKAALKPGDEGYVRPDAAASGLTNEQFHEVLNKTGGEEVVVGPSQVEGVERGGRTQGANEAQINEVRRLASELGWGAKAILGYAYALLEPVEPEVPADGRNARSVLTQYQENMSAEKAGHLVTNMGEQLAIQQGVLDKPDTGTGPFMGSDDGNHG